MTAGEALLVHHKSQKTQGNVPQRITSSPLWSQKKVTFCTEEVTTTTQTFSYLAHSTRKGFVFSYRN